MPTLYDPPLELAPIAVWEDYLAELRPEKDAEQIAETKAIIARKKERGDK